jgi:undecaprenyldiphospho-muramoylpentapeptide beta-N-acetylglucosaminyltransferase
LIAGGGTAGHVVPALAVAEELVSRGHPRDQIRFVGSRRGMEATMVPDAGFPIDLLPGRGINERRFNLSNLKAAAGLVGAAGAGLVLVARHRPAVVLGVGGYASLAPSMAAGLLRRPLVLHEQNARPGASNRAAARFAKACAVSLPNTPLPNPVLTGNPTSSSFTGLRRDEASRTQARRRLGLPSDKLVVASWGGSLGSRRINEAVRSLAQRWQHRADVCFRQVIGRRDFPGWQDPPAGAVGYASEEYERAMAHLMLAADFGVCRAGGMTVAELAATGLPAIVVPLPIATEDHQTANARALVDAGAALLVPDSELSVDRLDQLLGPLLADPSRLGAMSVAMSSLARPHAAGQVADLMEAHAR